MSDLFGNHIVGFPTRRFNCSVLCRLYLRFFTTFMKVSVMGCLIYDGFYDSHVKAIQK